MIDEFFLSPNVNLGLTGSFSVLYLLRRDIYVCFGLHPDDKRQLTDRALWPGAMGVLAGIDLLGKFYAGSDVPNESGKRFKLFIEENFSDINPKDENVIYQLRNALLHSFGLYSRPLKGDSYSFALQARNEILVSELAGNKFAIDITALWRKFEESIDTYYNKLILSDDLQRKFDLIQVNYGWVYIGERDPENYSTSAFSPG